MIDRTQLLPKSGVGVIGHWLVIAPPDAPVIRLDVRLLDRVEVCPPVNDEHMHNMDPLDVEARRSEIQLVCGDLAIALGIADGYLAAQRVAAAAAALTGSLARSDVRDALSTFLVVDGTVVRLRGDFIQVGSVAFRVTEVRECAEAGANLPLPGGHMLQAAMAMLVVAAAERTADHEDLG